jgi:hypothetical protein
VSVAARLEARVGFIEWMPGLAGRTAGNRAVDALTPSVLGPRDRLQVRGIDAAGVPAQVVERQAVRDRAADELEDHAVCEEFAPEFASYPAAPVGATPAAPAPAGSRAA